MGDCPHGMPTPASCVECMNETGLGAPPKPTVTVVAGPYPARFPGDCGGCHLGIHTGQSIVRLSNDRYVHEECAAS